MAQELVQLLLLVLTHGPGELINRVLQTANAVYVLTQEVAVLLNLLFPLTLYHCVDAVVTRSRNSNCEGPVVRVVEVDLDCERYWLLALENHLHLDLLLCHSQVSPVREVELDVHIRELLHHQVLDVDVLVPTVHYLEHRPRLLV